MKVIKLYGESGYSRYKENGFIFKDDGANGPSQSAKEIKMEAEARNEEIIREYLTVCSKMMVPASERQKNLYLAEKFDLDERMIRIILRNVREQLDKAA